MSNAIYGPIPNPYPPIQNKYYKWYISFCRSKQKERGLFSWYSSRKFKKLTCHHIIPKCLFVKYGGLLNENPNIKENIVLLTNKEHFICHKLLTKFYSGIAHQKMCLSFNLMCGGDKTSIHYDLARKLLSESMLGKNHPNYKKSPKNKGKPNPEHSKRMRGKMVGKLNPMYGRKGELNPMYGKHNITKRSKTWKLISPLNEEFIFPTLPKNFLKEHNLNPGGFYQIINGKSKHHKGWTCQILSDVG